MAGRKSKPEPELTTYGIFCVKLDGSDGLYFRARTADGTDKSLQNARDRVRELMRRHFGHRGRISVYRLSHSDLSELREQMGVTDYNRLSDGMIFYHTDGEFTRIHEGRYV